MQGLFPHKSPARKIVRIPQILSPLHIGGVCLSPPPAQKIQYRGSGKTILRWRVVEKRVKPAGQTGRTWHSSPLKLSRGAPRGGGYPFQLKDGRVGARQTPAEGRSAVFTVFLFWGFWLSRCRPIQANMYLVAREILRAKMLGRHLAKTTRT